MRGRFARAGIALSLLCVPLLLVECSRSPHGKSAESPTLTQGDVKPPTGRGEAAASLAEREASEPAAVAAPAPKTAERSAQSTPTPAPAQKPRADSKALGDVSGSAGLGLSGIGAGGGGRGFALGSRALAPKRWQSGPSAFNTEAYDHIQESTFQSSVDAPLSTFAIDVDTASYANVRRFLRDGQHPPPDAVRIEELVNYFSYDYPEPKTGSPFSVTTEVSACPWEPKHRLVHIGLKGKAPKATSEKPKNLVFLVDVSGSMQSADKLPLLRRGLDLLVREMGPKDRIAIAVYAGASGLALPSTPGSRKSEILTALHSLSAGGSTNGAQGIELAYRVAQQHFVNDGINRVILATDGDFNVGLTSQGELTRLIEQKRKSGVFLTVLGFGRGNLKDSTMEMLADKGNGNYAYIDSLGEARRVLVEQAGATLETIAKDVKIQVEFNPSEVQSYRLIGYENRMLQARDFNDDKKDAGEIGAGHTATALYEIVPAAAAAPSSEVDELKYQSARRMSQAAKSGELLTVKLRYKEPDGDRSRLVTHTVSAAVTPIFRTSSDFRFSAAVAAFGMVLRDSEQRGSATLPEIRRLAEAALGKDPNGLRRQLLAMIDRARELGIESKERQLAAP